MAAVKSSGTALDEITVHLATAASLREEIKRLEAAALEQEKFAERQAQDVFADLAPHFLGHARSGRNVDAVNPQVRVAVAAIMAGREVPAIAPVALAVSDHARPGEPAAAAPVAPVAPEVPEDTELYGVKIAAANLVWVDEIISDATRAARDGMSGNDQRYSRFMGSNAWRRKLFEAAFKELQERFSKSSEVSPSSRPPVPEQADVADEPPSADLDEVADEAPGDTPARGDETETPYQSEPHAEADLGYDRHDDVSRSDPADTMADEDSHVEEDEAAGYPEPEAESEPETAPADEPEPELERVAVAPSVTTVTRPISRPAFGRPGQRAVVPPAPATEPEVFGEEDAVHDDDDDFPSYMLDDEPPLANGGDGAGQAGGAAAVPETAKAAEPARKPLPGRAPIAHLPARPAPVGTPVRRSFNTPLGFSSSHLAGKDGRG